jgi:hypothetical protein
MIKRISSMALILALVRKDFKIIRRYLWIAIPVFLSYGAMFVVTTRSFLLACGIFSAAAAISPMWIETVMKSDLLLCSLPVSRTQIVVGRYVSCLVFILVGAAGTLLYGLLLDRLFDQASFGANAHLPAFISLIGVTFVGLSLFLPFFFRLGLGKGIVAFALGVVSIVCAGIVTSVVIHLTETGVFRSYTPARLIEFLLRVAGTMGTRGGLIAAIVVSVGVCVASFAISNRLYARRDF